LKVTAKRGVVVLRERDHGEPIQVLSSEVIDLDEEARQALVGER
jgi:hypothetical protein